MGGGIGPLRGGVSTKGFGVGLGPLNVGGGWPRASGSIAELLAYMVVLAIVALPFVWPYALLHERIGDAGAIAANVVWLLVLAGTIVARKLKRHAREVAMHAAQSRAQALADIELIDEVYAVLVGARRSLTADGRLLITELANAELVEWRATGKAGQRALRTVDRGVLQVTNVGYRFIGAAKTREWAYAKLIDVRAEADCTLWTVANRVTSSGIRTLGSAAQVLASVADYQRFPEQRGAIEAELELGRRALETAVRPAGPDTGT